jgi:predicted outer membrane protein
MQHSHFTLHGALFGAVMLTLLSTVACAIDEADPADEGKQGGLPSQRQITSDADTLRDAFRISDKIITDSETATVRGSAYVRDYAQRMIDSHNAARENAIDLLKRPECISSPSAMSAVASFEAPTAALAEADAVTAALQSVPMADFDSTYMAGQIERHEAVLALLNSSPSNQLLANLANSPNKQALSAAALPAADECSEEIREENNRLTAEWSHHLEEAKQFRP